LGIGAQRVSRISVFFFFGLVAGAVSAHPDHVSSRESAPAKAALGAASGDLEYRPVAGWCKLPDDRALGNTHGGIVIDASGLVHYHTDRRRCWCAIGRIGGSSGACASRRFTPWSAGSRARGPLRPGLAVRRVG